MGADDLPTHPERPADDEAEPRAVRRDDSYTEGVEIGRGGMGRVVVARDTVLDRDVALPRMVPGLTGQHLLDATTTLRTSRPANELVWPQTATAP